MVNVPEEKLVIIQGLNDYIVVEANNTLLICPKDQEQNVKKVVADVKQKFGTVYIWEEFLVISFQELTKN